MTRKLGIYIGICFMCVFTSACQYAGPWKGDFCRVASCYEETLKTDSTGRLVRVTNFTNGQVGRTVWQVKFQPRGTKDMKPVFCVERVMDEPIPGQPFLVISDGKTLIRDASRSYEYSLRKQTFIHNLHREGVYKGPYRPYFPSSYGVFGWTW